MTAKPSTWTRIRHALFGRPLTHEEVQASRDSQAAHTRSSAPGQIQSRAQSVQNQTWF